MRERPQETWERIERFRAELIELCDEVTGEMDHNRRAREEWHAYTRVWKRLWLPKPQSALNLPVEPVAGNLNNP